MNTKQFYFALKFLFLSILFCYVQNCKKGEYLTSENDCQVCNPNSCLQCQDTTGACTLCSGLFPPINNSCSCPTTTPIVVFNASTNNFLCMNASNANALYNSTYISSLQGLILSSNDFLQLKMMAYAINPNGNFNNYFSQYLSIISLLENQSNFTQNNLELMITSLIGLCYKSSSNITLAQYTLYYLNNLIMTNSQISGNLYYLSQIGEIFGLIITQINSNQFSFGIATTIQITNLQNLIQTALSNYKYQLAKYQFNATLAEFSLRFTNIFINSQLYTLANSTASQLSSSLAAGQQQFSFPGNSLNQFPSSTTQISLVHSYFQQPIFKPIQSGTASFIFYFNNNGRISSGNSKLSQGTFTTSFATASQSLTLTTYKQQKLSWIPANSDCQFSDPLLAQNLLTCTFYSLNNPSSLYALNTIQPACNASTIQGCLFCQTETACELCQEGQPLILPGSSYGTICECPSGMFRNSTNTCGNASEAIQEWQNFKYNNMSNATIQQLLQEIYVANFNGAFAIWDIMFRLEILTQNSTQLSQIQVLNSLKILYQISLKNGQYVQTYWTIVVQRLINTGKISYDYYPLLFIAADNMLFQCNSSNNRQEIFQAVFVDSILNYIQSFTDYSLTLNLQNSLLKMIQINSPQNITFKNTTISINSNELAYLQQLSNYGTIVFFALEINSNLNIFQKTSMASMLSNIVYINIFYKNNSGTFQANLTANQAYNVYFNNIAYNSTQYCAQYNRTNSNWQSSNVTLTSMGGKGVYCPEKTFGEFAIMQGTTN